MALVALAAACLCACAERDAATPLPKVAQKEPRGAASVYWVGHSLMNHADPTQPGAVNLMQVVGSLARARGQAYAHYDHTLWGTPLSENWSGESERGDKPAKDRAYLSKHGSQYDVFVLTEVVPLEEALPWHDSAFYLRKFYCEALRLNPDAEVFLYETWPDSQKALRPEAPRSFEERLRHERRLWEQLADEALSSEIPDPGRVGHVLSYLGIHQSHCAATQPIRFIPGGSAMLALSERLRELGDAAPSLEDGTPLDLAQLFRNPLEGWRFDLPPDQPPNDTAHKLRDPSKEPDDIHLSAAGTYFIGLVAYSAIYRTDPAGLPPLQGVGADAAALMQQLAWNVVLSDPRVGVQPGATAKRETNTP